MLTKWVMQYKKKSLKERFLLFMGILFFFFFLTLGLMIIFWKKIPLNMDDNYRLMFGGLLIVYAFFRFLRFFNSSEPTEES
nr:hypothetical protein [Flavobacterium sp.]